MHTDRFVLEPDTARPGGALVCARADVCPQHSTSPGIRLLSAHYSREQTLLRLSPSAGTSPDHQHPITDACQSPH